MIGTNSRLFFGIIYALFWPYFSEAMTDYKQEQRDEIEAIESIYSEEIDIMNDNPHR